MEGNRLCVLLVPLAPVAPLVCVHPVPFSDRGGCKVLGRLAAGWGMVYVSNRRGDSPPLRVSGPSACAGLELVCFSVSFVASGHPHSQFTRAHCPCGPSMAERIPQYDCELCCELLPKKLTSTCDM